MIQQRITARDKQGVRTDVGHLNREFTRFDAVGAQSPCLDDSLFAQLLQPAKCTLAGDFELCHPFVTVKVSRYVMNPHEIHMVDAEPLETILDRLHRAALGVVVDDLVWPAMFEEIALFPEIANLMIDVIQDESSYLCAEPVFVPFVPRQGLPQTHF